MSDRRSAHPPTGEAPDHDHGEGPVVRLTRRRALSYVGGLGALILAGCSSGDDRATASASTSGGGSTTSGPATSTTTAPTTTTSVAAAATTAPTTTTTAAPVRWLSPPAETGGPFPADGSNGNGAGGTADVLHRPEALRTDMTADLDGSNRQPGIPLELDIRIGRATDRSAFAGAAVYVWHCNVDGRYSAYSGAMNGGDFSARSFLRAVGVADADGRVRFRTILPGRYQGRASHIHFAVFRDRSLGERLLTSQFAFDDAGADALYRRDAAYAGSLANPTYNSRDNVFSDGVDEQLLTVSERDVLDAAIAILV